MLCGMSWWGLITPAWLLSMVYSVIFGVVMTCRAEVIAREGVRRCTSDLFLCHVQ